MYVNRLLKNILPTDIFLNVIKTIVPIELNFYKFNYCVFYKCAPKDECTSFVNYFLISSDYYEIYNILIYKTKFMNCIIYDYSNGIIKHKFDKKEYSIFKNI